VHFPDFVLFQIGLPAKLAFPLGPLDDGVESWPFGGISRARICHAACYANNQRIDARGDTPE